MNPLIIILSSFMLGLTGGFGHCVAMCHPFVLYISTRYTSSSAGFLLLVPQIKYNLGRTVTYTIMGAVIGGLGRFADIANFIKGAQKIIILTAGVLLIIYALTVTLGKHFPLPKIIGSLLKHLPVLTSPYLTGMVLGLLPCGLVFGALITSSASSDMLTGALSMAAFGTGTSAALLLLSLFGGAALKYVSGARWLFAAVIFLTGLYYIYMGIKMA